MEKVNVRNIIKLVSIILGILFFVPAFMVSCSGQNVNVSAAQIMGGVTATMYGEKEKITDPVPGLIFLLLIPAAIAVIWFLKKYIKPMLAALITLLASIIDLIVWIVLRAAVKTYAEESYFDFRDQGGFGLSIFFLIVNMALAVMVLIKFLDADKALFGGGAANGRAPASMGQAAPPNYGQQSPYAGGWQCPSCGTFVGPEALFCPTCGGKKPEPAAQAAPIVQPAPTPAPAPQMQAGITPAPAPVAASIIMPEAAAESMPEAEAQPQPAAQPEAEPQSMPEAEAAAQPAAEPVQEAAAEPAPAPTARFCPGCGTPVEPGTRFCRKCGTRVAE